MTTDPTEPIRVALLGFSEFERSALVGYFRLTSRRRPCFTQVLGVDDAHLVVADADHPEALELLRRLGRVCDAVFVGGQGPDDAAGWIMRPISLTHVLRELEAAVRDRGLGNSASLPLGLPSVSGMGGLGDLFGVGTALEATIAGRRSGDAREPGSAGRSGEVDAARHRRARLATMRPTVAQRALLVDDSEIALHFLSRHLQAYPLAIDTARNAAQALAMMARQRYGLVFLDLDLGGDDGHEGLALCQHICQQMPHAPGTAPVVAIVSAFSEPVDKVRSALAGAQHHLGKPLDPQALDALMSHLGFVATERTPPSSPKRPGDRGWPAGHW